MSDTSYTQLPSGPTPAPPPAAAAAAIPAGAAAAAQAIGEPAAPSSHPGNQAAASTTPDHSTPDVQCSHIPPAEGFPAHPPPVYNTYVQTAPVAGPFDKLSQALSGVLRQATEATNNIVSHLQAGTSTVDTALGKLEQGVKIAFSGGPELHWRQCFNPPLTDVLVAPPFGCFLSTSTGPVAGYIYVSKFALCFASDKPLPYTPIPSQIAYSYYKVILPFAKMDTLSPSVNPARPMEKYIQIVTQDKAEFWFMGFISFEQALESIQMALAQFRSLESASVPGYPVSAPALTETPGAPGPALAAALAPTGSTAGK